MRSGTKPLTLAQENDCIVCLAKSNSHLCQRIKHHLQIEIGAADHLKHISDGGLLLQRLPQLVEQPGILDGDDRLGGETLDQLDLFLCEGTNLLTIDRDQSDQLIVLKHRYSG